MSVVIRLSMLLFFISLQGSIYSASVPSNETDEVTTTSATPTTTLASTTTTQRIVRAKTNLVDPCAKCIKLAERSKEEFTKNKWFKIFERDDEPDPVIKAGLRSCEEFRWAYQCFQHCIEDLKDGAVYSYPKEYENLGRIITKYCEDSWSDGRSCRMADTRVCDMKYNKRLCGDHLKRYTKCVSDTLEEANQDCSGVCTPARRYHKVVNYEWDAECKLKRSIDGRCIDYVQLYCFSEMKDTELSWGLFEELNRDEDYSNLRNFCPIMEYVSECLMSAVTDTVNYFGFELKTPCASVEDEVIELVEKWNDIIYPLCEGRDNSTTHIQELCGEAPTTQRIPSTTTTLPPPTTPLKTKRIKIVRRLRKNNTNKLMFSPVVVVIMALVSWSGYSIL